MRFSVWARCLAIVATGDLLGSEHRFPTQLFASRPSGSSIEGELVIVPEHDVFATTDF